MKFVNYTTISLTKKTKYFSVGEKLMGHVIKEYDNGTVQIMTYRGSKFVGKIVSNKIC